MKLKKLLSLIASFCLILVLATLPFKLAAAPKTLTVGIAVPLTGPVAHIGTHYQNAALLAIENQNAEGGVTIAGQKYKLDFIIRDTKYDPAVGKTVAEELVYNKKVKFIVGPTQVEAMGMQPVTEANKVLLFGMSPVPGLCAPDKPYSFWLGGFPPKMYILGATYIHENYPEAKTVASIYPDVPDAPPWIESVQAVCQQYGLDWLGGEKFPYTITDFMPVISRVLDKNPDIIDTVMTGGVMGGLSCLLVKQLREAGFEGVIWMPAVSPPGTMEEAVPQKYRTKIVTNDINVGSPIVSQTYKDLYAQYVKEFREKPMDLFPEAYNGVKAFLEFLDGQDTMDTEVWMEGFAKYRWQGIFGHEEYWVGKPVYGINRFLLASLWCSEWKDGKLQTNWLAPIPYEMFVEK
jgi:ABC-type branched-subunit amino acid transport system substrate-binding protein